MYYGQTERSFQTRIAQHKKAVARFDEKSKVSCYVHHFIHNMNVENVKVVGFDASYHERLSRNPGTLLWTRTLGTILSYFQKPTKDMVTRASFSLRSGRRKKFCALLRYLNSPSDNELCFYITDEGFSISRKSQWQIFFHSIYGFENVEIYCFSSAS